MKSENIFSLDEFIRKVSDNTKDWDFSESQSGCPWYRGQDREAGPIPKIFRHYGYNEFDLTRMFRERAGAFGQFIETDRIDKWLFLMQHYGTPTRLLDWTESPLIALFFALESFVIRPENEKILNKPSVWVLHPLILNSSSNLTGFPNTWTRIDTRIIEGDTERLVNINPGVEYFRLAFASKTEWKEKINLEIVKLPIAIQTTYLDQRMYSQRSCFTIHGTIEEDFESIFNKPPYNSQNFLLKYVIHNQNAEIILEELKKLGINKATIFPDLQGLSIELKERFKNIRR